VTALSESLTEAQRGAMKALTKAIIAGKMGDEDAQARLERIGLTDAVDTVQWLAALEVLRDLGGNVAEPLASRSVSSETEPATDRQLAFMRELAEKAGVVIPERPFTKDRASEAISQLKAGTFDPDKWEVPF
jgi:nucleotide-binding universal stress UspA family protein